MPKLIITTGGFIKLFTGTFDGYEFGRLLAVVLISFIHLGITYVLWKYGLKWVKPKAKQNTSYE